MINRILTLLLLLTISMGAYAQQGAGTAASIYRVLFANLGTPANGSVRYCIDCQATAPCASGGTGAFANRVNGAWNCGSGGSSGGGITNSAGANVIPKSDGSNLVASNATDNGSTFSITASTLFGLATPQINANATVTAGGTTGAQTINKSAGSVNFAATATSLVVTNSTVASTSIIICTVGTNDATLKSVQCIAGSGSFTMFANAAAAAETRVNFWVITPQ